MAINQDKKEQLKDSVKILLTIIGVNAALTLGLIVAASVSNKPKYDKHAHREARRAYYAACDDYATTYNVAVHDAESAVRIDNKNLPLLWQIMVTEGKIENCTDDLKYNKLAERLDSLNNEMENRIGDSLSTHRGLIAATDEMAAARAELEKYERDSAARAAWARIPLNRRINNMFREIFLTEQQRIARAKQFYDHRKHNGK